MVFRRAHFRDKGEKREKATGNKYGSKNGRMICSAKVIICKKVLNFSLKSLGTGSKKTKDLFYLLIYSHPRIGVDITPLHLVHFV